MRVSGINVDITEEKGAAAACSAKSQFVALCSKSSSVVYVRDLRDRSHAFINRHVAEVIGYTPDESSA